MTFCVLSLISQLDQAELQNDRMTYLSILSGQRGGDSTPNPTQTPGLKRLLDVLGCLGIWRPPRTVESNYSPERFLVEETPQEITGNTDL